MNIRLFYNYLFMMSQEFDCCNLQHYVDGSSVDRNTQQK